MELKVFLTVFAADRSASKLIIFTAASTALVVATAIGVLAGGVVAQYVGPKTLNYAAGTGFIGIGIWTLLRA